MKESEKFKGINTKHLFEYFEKNYLKGNKYPISAWNAHQRIMDDIPLTSNSAEVFNRHFYAKFDQCHPGLSTFFDKLRLNQSNVENDIEHKFANMTNQKNSKYKDKLTQIKTICLNYSNYYGMTYLELIAKLYAWKFD